MCHTCAIVLSMFRAEHKTQREKLQQRIFIYSRSFTSEQRIGRNIWGRVHILWMRLHRNPSDVYPISNCGEWFATNIFFTLPSMLVVHFAWRAEPTKTSTASFESNHKFMYIKLITMRTCRGKNNIAWRMSWRKKNATEIFSTIYSALFVMLFRFALRLGCVEKRQHTGEMQRKRFDFFYLMLEIVDLFEGTICNLCHNWGLTHSYNNYANA